MRQHSLPQASLSAARRVPLWNHHHYTHVPKFVTVHYRFHPKYGNQLKCRHRVCNESSGALLVVEGEDGFSLGIPEWMTKTEACEGIEQGERLVAVNALIELIDLIETLRSGRIDNEVDKNPEGDNGRQGKEPTVELADGSDGGPGGGTPSQRID